MNGRLALEPVQDVVAGRIAPLDRGERADPAPHAALHRLEPLVQEAAVVVPRRLIAEAIDLVVFIAGRGVGRRIGALATVEGLDAAGDYVLRRLEGEPAVYEETS